MIKNTGSTSMRQRGAFCQGSHASFLLSFSDIDGYPYDPVNIDVTITTPSGTVADTGDPVKLDEGQYAFDFSIANDAETGLYTLAYSFSVPTEDAGIVISNIEEGFIVVEQGDKSVLSSGNYPRMRNYLESILGETQNVPVKNEQARFDRARKRGKLTFPRWNQSSSAEVRRNNTLIDTGFSVDWLRGEIIFDRELETFDNIDVCYNFRWFSDEELEQFMESGIQRLNMFPPFSTYNLASVPSYWMPVTVWGAAVEAIRRFMMDLMFQQPSLVFGDPERSAQIFDKMNVLKQNYEEDLKASLEAKKKGPYPSIASIVAPELSLPGARSRWFRYLYGKSV